MAMLSVWKTHGKNGYRFSNETLSKTHCIFIRNAKNKHNASLSSLQRSTTIPTSKVKNIMLLQTISRAQATLTDRLIKNLKVISLPNGHFWSELVIYKRDRFDHWRCLTCYKPMGKKDRHQNSILYPEYLTTLTDDNYIDASGDDVHHGHSAHLYAGTYLHRRRLEALAIERKQQ